MTHNIRDYIAENYPDADILLADGFDEAFVGVSSSAIKNPVAVYSRARCVEILSRDMSVEDAEEYFEFNVASAYVGENTPHFIDMYVTERSTTSVESVEKPEEAFYFAKDGNYGSAEGLLVVDTEAFTEIDWETIEDSLDSDRVATVRAIINDADGESVFEL